MVCLGGLTQGSHLFPFRTEKLSLVVVMILIYMGKVASRQDKIFNTKKANKKPKHTYLNVCFGFYHVLVYTV